MRTIDADEKKDPAADEAQAGENANEPKVDDTGAGAPEGDTAGDKGEDKTEGEPSGDQA